MLQESLQLMENHTPNRFEQDWLKPKTRISRPVPDRPGRDDLRRGRGDDRWANGYRGGQWPEGVAVVEKDICGKLIFKASSDQKVGHQLNVA